MIYSHYSEYMAKAMSAARPGFDPGELEYLLPYLKSNEAPFLELGCGYGRLLLPIMELGYTIYGSDSSQEMLDQCRLLAKEKNLHPTLFKQFMQKLEIDEKFGLIFIDDCTFTLVIEDNDVHELFERVFNHLKPNGTFLFDFFGYFPNENFAKNNVEKKYTTENWITTSDNTLYVSKKISNYNPVTKITSTLQIHDCYVNGNLVGSQAYDDPNKNHNVEEIVSILTTKGFNTIKVAGYNTENAPDENGTLFSIRCKKPETHNA